MAWKFLQMHSNVLEIAKISALALPKHYSGKVQVKLFKKLIAEDEINLARSKSIVIETLEKLLNIRKSTAIDLLTQQKKLYQVHTKILSRNHKVLSQHGINNATIIKYPEILASQIPADLEKNLTTIKKLPYPIEDVVYLVNLDKDKLKQLLEKDNFLPKVDVLMRKLDTTIDVLIVAFVNRPFLGKMSLSKIEENIDLLKENHVKSADIIRDWWVLQYTPKTIVERIATSKKNNMDPIKTWMIRCSSDILERYMQRRSDNELVLGDNTRIEYLSQRLQCTSEDAKALMTKLPALKNKNMKKMEEIIDFLYSEGFQPYHIRRTPKILLHSVQTTKKRIRELEQQGVQTGSLHMLTKSQCQYMQYYQALVKSNANKVQHTTGDKSNSA